MSEDKSEGKAQVKEEVSPKRKPIKKFFKTFVDVKKWSSFDEVSANTKNTWGLFKRLFSRGGGEKRQETYEEAIARLSLNPEEVVARKNNFLYSTMIYAFFALGFFSYLVYLLLNARFLAASLTIVLVALMLVAAYREHFWYMQMSKKKLGCSFKEWLDFVLRRNVK